MLAIPCAAGVRLALAMPADGQRARMRLMRGLVREFNVFRWAGRMLIDAAAMRERSALRRFARAGFLVPMVLLMSRDAKRNPRFLIGVGVVIIIGHWLDLCQMVLPGALGDHFEHIGLLEIGLFLAYLGIFILTVLNALTKAPLSVVNHPYLDESVHHQI